MYKWVKKYIGIPFVSNGRTMEGCDCYGLVRLVLRNEYDINLPELSDNYNDAKNIKETEKLFADNLPVLTVGKNFEPKEKALVVITENGRKCHVGIVAGDGFVLHTGAKTGCICQRDTHPGLRNRIEGYYNVC